MCFSPMTSAFTCFGVVSHFMSHFFLKKWDNPLRDLDPLSLMTITASSCVVQLTSPKNKYEWKPYLYPGLCSRSPL